ncbi:MAG: ATP-binding cassette domain-containing protein [Aquificota bacterium]
MEKVLEVVDVKKSYGGNLVLDCVSLSVKRGEVVGLLGPNGSGKTTLLNIISGIIRQDSGTLRFKGIDISGLPSYRRARLGIGRTFQIPRPFWNLTLWENIQIASHHAGKGAEVEELLKRVGLYELRNKKGGELSLAQRKRLELARALALKPSLLLLDEVFAGLNPASIKEIQSLLKELKEEGISILMVEHVLKALFGLVDRVVVLHGGRIVYDGSLEGMAQDQEVRRAYLGERHITFEG